MGDETGHDSASGGEGEVGQASTGDRASDSPPPGGHTGATSEGGAGSENANPTGEEPGPGNIGRTPVSNPASRG
jgi:hypothetical protein